MTIRITRVLTADEKAAMEEESIAKGWYRNDRRMFVPGMAWHQEFYWMPAGWPRPAWMGMPGRVAEPRLHRGDSFLSIHYWQTWADKRPPVEVVLPNGETWEIDRKSSNGAGWIVVGDLPNITCAPSIAAQGYHGFLRDGQFTPDIDRPGLPNGVYPYPES